MSIPATSTRPRITFLFADTGGGHRSAATSIIQAIQRDPRAAAFEIVMIDILKDYAPRPMDKFDKFYTQITKTPAAWKFGYNVTDTRRRAQWLHRALWPYVKRASHRLLRENESALIVSVHFASNALLRAMGPRRPAFLTVVTDLVTTHAMWYDRRMDACLVPTEDARRKAVECGMRPSQMEVTGLPVPAAFTQTPPDKAQARRDLGWPEDRPVALLMGGAEGFGPLFRLARHIAHSHPAPALAVVTGRNEALRRRMEAYPWPVPTFIYGFTREIPQMMAASDILLSKAGPSTICEAFHLGLPIILYHRVPGQEEGNVRYVVEHGAGLWAPRPRLAAAALSALLRDPAELARMAEASRALARPDAAARIADRVLQMAERTARIAVR